MSFIYVLAGIFIFGFLVAIHELGHFLAARLCGVRVQEFSIGMGPLLWHRETGETRYSLRLLPIGGFFSGLSLGRRHGVCPLYPAACGAMYLPIIFWLLNHTALYHCGIAFFSPLLGNLAGAACTRNRRRQKGDK